MHQINNIVTFLKSRKNPDEKKQENLRRKCIGSLY